MQTCSLQPEKQHVIALVPRILPVSVFLFRLNPDRAFLRLYFPCRNDAYQARPQSFHFSAGFLTFQSKYDEADRLYLRALKILGEIEGDGHPTYASALTNRAAMLHTQVKRSRKS